MTTTIQTPEGEDALTEFILFQDRINSSNEAWWPATVPMHLPTLLGEGPEAKGRRYRPFVARRGEDIVARVLATVDEHYIGHWDEQLGHLTMFEALPDSRDAVRKLMDEACGWLRGQGMKGARAGFGQNDFPFLVNSDGALPPVMLRQNPAYYHTLLKEGGFASERGWVDYRIEVSPELQARWASSVHAVEARGIELTPYRDVPRDVRTQEWISTWNQAFSTHWGTSPQTAEEHDVIASFLEPMGMGDLSVIAHDGEDPVGVVWVVPELASALARVNDGRSLRPEERLNFLGIGVLEQARGKGVAMAMASYAYLELARRGATHVSYTLVLDDNWPSRRTAEKLGATICANYMVYRRDFSD